MRFRVLVLSSAFAVLSAALVMRVQAQSPFTLQQVLSAPFATDLTAAPTGAMFAWVEDAEGRHNLWVGGPKMATRPLTHNTVDDAQDISEPAWAPDASAIAYTYGAETGADGKPANPAHLQRATPVTVIVQPLAADAKPMVLGEGHSPMFLPDGKSVMFVRGGQIYVAALADGVAHQLVVDRGTASSLTLSPDGRTLAFISSRREVNQPSHRFLALFDMATKTLSFPAPSTGNDSAPAFSPDGKHLAWLRTPFSGPPQFAPNRVSATPWSIELLDLGSRVTRAVYTPEANKPGSVLPHMATGSPRLFYTANSQIIFPSEADGYVHLYFLNPTNPTQPTLLTPGDGEVEDVSLSADRKEVFWISNIPMNTVAYAGLSDCMGPILGLEMADTERRHISSVDVTKLPAAHQETTKQSSARNLFKEDSTRRTTGEGIETHPVPLADGSLVALASNSFIPMHPVFVAKDGSLTDVKKQWLPGTYPQQALVFPEEVSFPFFEGSQGGEGKASTTISGEPLLHAQLFLPGNKKASGDDPLPWCNGHKTASSEKTPERHPAILFFHGGPRRQMLLGYPAMGYYSNAYAMNQYLTSLGFIVLSTNYRCGIGYGMEFRQCLDAGGGGGTEYNDVLAAQKYLAGRADVDASRIGIWGGSYGGYLTALGLARNSDLFAAGVDYHGVHDWNLEDNAGDWLVGSYAEKDAIAARALKSSPLADVSKWSSPILFVHGDNDANVAYAQTPILADKLRARNAELPKDKQVDVEEMIFPDELHEFALHSSWLKSYEAAAAFFVRVLKP